MISRESGRIQPRLSLSELRSGEIRMDIQQGPVPASLLPGYKRPEPVFRLPEPPPEAPPEQIIVRPSRPRQGTLEPVRDPQPLGDIEARRAAVAACIAGRVWRTAWEIARETGFHPEVVRNILRSSCAVSRPVAEEQIKARGAHIEYAARGTPCETVYVPKPRRPRWTHALCEVCEGVQEFVEAPLIEGTDIVCATCRSVIATLYRGNPASGDRRRFSRRIIVTENPTPTPGPTQPSEPTGPNTPTTPTTPTEPQQPTPPSEGL